ncbi:hypothetical protein E3A20_11630 [Planctomyces bekefii]|uniref:NADH-Ubiquinone oxidoreductase (complex I) chain 5 N-terminal domain-containing protein n=1 Tax=Planctomyces bekefii TaxID=1653850 RepID=A0A5C6M665_9PLAN|nr:hypothetical protein E3A20_11630 [Planctomyces bekefii]
MLTFAGILVVLSPAVLVALFGISTLLRTSVGETVYSRCTAAAVSTGLAAAVWILVAMLMTDDRQVEVSLGDWVRIPAAAEQHAGEPPGGAVGVSQHASDEPHFHFTMKFMFDRLSVPFVIMTFVLCGVISAFASRYLHRDGGFQRFFLFLSFFLLGMILSSAAGTIETLFFRLGAGGAVFGTAGGIFS